MPPATVELQRALDTHNLLRAQHGSPPLVWSDSCALTAQSYAQYLIDHNLFKHGMKVDATGAPVGQNLAWSSNRTWDPSNAVQKWYDEVSLYNFGNPKFSPSTGHFTQVVWKDTQKVGIGKASNALRTIVVAHYSSPGNVTGKFASNVLAHTALSSRT